MFGFIYHKYIQYSRMFKNPSLDKFCDQQRELLLIEHEAELAESTELVQSETPQDLQNRGLAILGLNFSHASSGLFGKTIVTLSHHLASSKKHQDVSLPATTLSSGDIVGVFAADSLKSQPIVTGVVHAIDRLNVKIVLDGEDDAPKLFNYNRFSIAQIGNNVTHSRLTKTVNDLEKSNHQLLSYLFGISDAAIGDRDHDIIELLTPGGRSLNDPQQAAVRNAICNPLITIIQGPPGTGKTTTLGAFIHECIQRDPGIKILACAPSNVAVDNLAARVLSLGISSIVRVGHPTRVSDEMLSHCLDALVDKSDFASSCVEIRKEIQTILDARRGYSALKPLRKELREREAKSIEQVFRQSNVIFTTCNGAFNLDRKLGIKSSSSHLFDLCVIDECAQALEMSCWIPILQSQRVVLGGDHHQLSATIHSKAAEKRGLGTTLFERCFTRFNSSPNIDNVLTIQYRMNKTIMEWSNRQFYKNVLVAHDSVTDITLEVPLDLDVSLNGIDMRSIIESPFVFCDTVGVEGMSEDVCETASSKSNTGELGLVTTYIKLIHLKGITDDICIVSPYMKQTELIRNALREKHGSIEVSTVDSFQGREGDVIIISLVRSNPTRVVGFLSDYRRLNVAVTRAKRHVFIIGDSETISSDPTLKSLYDYACDEGLVISAQSLVNE